MTSSDVGLRVRCNYNLTDKTVTHTSDLQVDGEQTAQMETSEVEAPNVTMAITDRYILNFYFYIPFDVRISKKMLLSGLEGPYRQPKLGTN